MRLTNPVVLSSLLLAGCATMPADAPPAMPAPRPASASRAVPADLQSITYSTSPCFGACPVYAVTVTRDGRGNWEGQRYVAAMGDRAFAATPQQFAAFAAALEPHRPNGDRRLVTQEECGRFATDLDGVDIVWQRAGGRQDVLSAYYGCDMEANRAMFDALRGAIRQLPVAALIGPAAR